MGIYDPILNAYQHGADQNLALQRTPNYADQILQRLRQGEHDRQNAEISSARLQGAREANTSEILGRQIKAMEAAANYGTDENQPAMQEMLRLAGFSGDIQPGMGAKALHEQNAMEMLKLKLAAQKQRDDDRFEAQRLIQSMRQSGQMRAGSQVGKVIQDYMNSVGTPAEWDSRLLRQALASATYKADAGKVELNRQGLQVPVQVAPLSGDIFAGDSGQHSATDALPQTPQAQPAAPIPAMTPVQKLKSKLPQKPIQAQPRVSTEPALNPKGSTEVAKIKAPATMAIASLDKSLRNVEETLNHPGFKSLGGINVERFAPGTDARTAYAKLGQILDKGFLDSIGELKKSGGTLGSVTEKEGERVTRAYAAIDPMMKNEDLRKELVKLVSIMNQAKKNILAAANIQLEGWGRKMDAPATGGSDRPRTFTDSRNNRSVTEKSPGNFVYDDDGSKVVW